MERLGSYQFHQHWYWIKNKFSWRYNTSISQSFYKYIFRDLHNNYVSDIVNMGFGKFIHCWTVQIKLSNPEITYEDKIQWRLTISRGCFMLNGHNGSIMSVVAFAKPKIYFVIILEVNIYTYHSLTRNIYLSYVPQRIESGFITFLTRTSSSMPGQKLV